MPELCTKKGEEMNKEEIKAVLAIINRQCFVGVNREAIENLLEYRLLRSAATKLERMLLDIESGYNKLVNAENARKGAELNKALHPHEIQIATFSQLLTCETLLKPEYKMRIDRCCTGTFLVYILRTDKGKPSSLFCWKLKPANISTAEDVEEHIRLFWEDVPNQYKK